MINTTPIDIVRKSTGAVLAFTLLAAAPAPAAFTPFSVPAGSHLQDPTFTPDGRTLYLSQGNADGTYAIVTSTLQGDTWSSPSIAPFSGRWRDLEEILSPDGQTMVFASNRPAEDGGQPVDGSYGGKARPGLGGNLWRVRRTAGAWTAPERLPDSINTNGNMFSPALGPDGTLYYMSTAADGHFHLLVAKLEGSTYATGTLAPFDDKNASSFDPTIASDGSFLIFSSNRPPAKTGTSDLFITYRRNGTWTAPTDLNQSVNPDGNATEARLSPDNRTLYFNTAKALWHSEFSGATSASVLPAPTIFAPSVVHDNDSSPSFSPDGRTLIYARSTANRDEIVESHLAGGGWSQPTVVAFSGSASDMDPVFSPDGSYVVFSSDRTPAAAGGKAQLWKVSRLKDEWGEPALLPSTIDDGAFLVAPSLANDGTLYYLRIDKNRGHQLYRALLTNGTYATPQALSFSMPAMHDFDPAPAPDQSFIVFSSSGRSGSTDKKRHLYITFAQKGGWSPPVRVRYDGDTTPSDDAGPLIARDAATMYFSSDRGGSSNAWALAVPLR
jgi:Tol biopolymer transport system component